MNDRVATSEGSWGSNQGQERSEILAMTHSSGAKTWHSKSFMEEKHSVKGTFTVTSCPYDSTECSFSVTYLSGTMDTNR